MSTDDRVRRWFEGYAADFARLYRGKPWPARIAHRLLRRSIELRFERVLELARQMKAQKVLDVGCGPGWYGVALAREGARVVGIDFSGPMLELARARARNSGVADLCEFYEADFINFEHPGRFDLVIALGFFDYTPSPLRYLKRMREFTSGIVAASFPIRDHPLNWQRRARYSLRGVPVYLYSKRRIVRLAQLSGLKPLRLERIARDYLLVAKPGSGIVE